MATLRLVLGDQISDNLSALRDLDIARDTVLFAEVRDETSYVKHHKQKIALVFAAMRGFAARLRARGVRVRYVGIEQAGNSHSITGELARATREEQFQRVVLTEAGEWRLREAFEVFAARSPVPLEIREDDRFVCSHQTFARWAASRQELRMELFYREMRKRTGLLMDGTKPEGGRWNFDRENRKRLPKQANPPPHRFSPPNATARGAMADVARLFPDHFGSLDAFAYPTTPDEAEQIVGHFLGDLLPSFGDYQDAMASGEPFLWHSVISAAMNIGLIDPLDVCRRAEAEYRSGRAPLNAVEGFIRQIIGWREFVRGVYWLKMPDYARRNVLDADRRLPWFYWSGDTEMACVRDVVRSAEQYAYAHHIQRLMVTGQLAMLLGVAPAEINDWYMVVFADAFEWVELPNTHGMATFADGGIVGTKPYAASGAYINRMSDYCGGCRYDVKQRIGDDACPFNALYWDFLARNEGILRGNVRLAMPYRNLARMGANDRAEISRQAARWRKMFGAAPVDSA